MPKDGVTVIAMILIASFAIERIVTTLFFLLSFSKSWRRRLPDPESVTDIQSRAAATRKRRLAYGLASAVIVILVLVAIENLRVLTSLGLAPIEPQPKPEQNPISRFEILDAFLTGLILMGGADQLARTLSSSAERGPQASQDLKVTGRLTLDQSNQEGQSGPKV